MDDLTTMTAAELAAAVAAGSVSAAEVTQAHLDRITAVDGDVRAFLHVNGEDALAAGPRGGPQARGGRAAGRAGRGAGRGEGPVHHHRGAGHLRIEDPRGLVPAV